MSGAYTYLIAKNNDGTIEIRRPRRHRNRFDKLCTDCLCFQYHAVRSTHPR